MRMLAWRNLVHDKVRLAVTVTGIVFAVVLIVVQLGLFLGFTTATSSMIDRSNADLWITAPRVPYIEQGVPFSERKLNTVLATPGVKTASKYIAQFTQWKRPDGRQDSVRWWASTSGPGWSPGISSRTVLRSAEPDAVFVDGIYREARRRADRQWSDPRHRARCQLRGRPRLHDRPTSSRFQNALD
jgi:putative ABC transport system permease protein